MGIETKFSNCKKSILCAIYQRGQNSSTSLTVESLNEYKVLKLKNENPIKK